MEPLPSRSLNVAALATAAVFSLLMLGSGIAFVIGPPQVAATARELGLPLAFFRMLGVAKLAGALALWAPRRARLREWAYAGFTFDLGGAIAMHLAAGSAFSHVRSAAIPLAVMTVSYLLRRRVEVGATPAPVVSGAGAHRTIWFGRAVLAASSLLFVRIAFTFMFDPVGAAAQHSVTLGSSDAYTMFRVNGALFLSLAACFVFCALAARRLVAGLGFLAVIADVLLVARLVGIGVDGYGPFSAFALKPEIVLAVFSTVALVLEDRRRRGAPAAEAPLALAPEHT